MGSWWFLAENGGNIFLWHIRCLSPGYEVFYFTLIYDLGYQPVLQLSMYMIFWSMIITRSNMPVILTPVIVVGHSYELSRAVWWYLSIFIFKICRLLATLLCKIGMQNYWIIENIIVRDMTASGLAEVSRHFRGMHYILPASQSKCKLSKQTAKYISTSLHSSSSQKMVTFIVSAMRPSNLVYGNIYWRWLFKAKFIRNQQKESVSIIHW
jgi:hypothetical protein